MALDGAFLRHLKKEITDRALGARVDKIYQPNKEELVFLLRTRQEAFKLLLSARANSPRIHFTQYAPETLKFRLCYACCCENACLALSWWKSDSRGWNGYCIWILTLPTN